eukprot:sb/3463734/
MTISAASNIFQFQLLTYISPFFTPNSPPQVEGWYNNTKLPCNTYQAADEGDASFLYVPVGLTVTVFCPTRHILVGAVTYTCTDEGFDPPIKENDDSDNTTTQQIDPHPRCVSVDELNSAVMCDATTLHESQPHYKLYSDANYVFVERDYQVKCEAGYSTALGEDLIYGRCAKNGTWTVTGSECLAMCNSDIVFYGDTTNTLTSYSNYAELKVTTERDAALLSVGEKVNLTISCDNGYSPTATRTGNFQLTCSVTSLTDTVGHYRQTRHDPLVDCKRDCEVPVVSSGRLIDPYTGLQLVEGTRTMRNGVDAAMISCPTGTYSVGRVEMECLDGQITHDLPTCTVEYQPCEPPSVENGVRDPHNLPPGDVYTIQCEPGYSLPLSTSPHVSCETIPGRTTDLGSPASELSPTSSYTCHEGCPLPLSSISNGNITPAPSSSGAPYKRGEHVTITCFKGTGEMLVSECLWDGWEREDWPECGVDEVDSSSGGRSNPYYEEKHSGFWGCGIATTVEFNSNIWYLLRGTSASLTPNIRSIQ